jgi:hypothetical protein
VQSNQPLSLSALLAHDVKTAIKDEKHKDKLKVPEQCNVRISLIYDTANRQNLILPGADDVAAAGDKEYDSTH